MSVMDAPLFTVPARSRAASWRGRWFAGLTWQGIALVVAVAALNALHRIHGHDRLDGGVRSLCYITAMSSLSLLPAFAAVVATCKYGARSA